MFRYWIRIGIKMGWVSPVICATHNGTYEWESEENRREWDEGFDPCTHVMVVLK